MEAGEALGMRDCMGGGDAGLHLYKNNDLCYNELKG